MTDERREDGGGSAPGLEHLLVAGLIHFLDPLKKLGGAKRAFLDASGHVLLPPLLAVAVLDDELLREYNEIETVGKLRFSDNLCSARQRRENGLSRQAGNYIIRTGFMK